MMQSDGDVLARVRNGDTEAFGVLVQRYYSRCLRYALHMVGDPELAQDLVQETMVRAYSALATYRHEDRFDRWLLAILANRARTAAARRGRDDLRLVHVRPESATALQLHTTNGHGDPLLRARLDDAMRALSPTLREAILLRFVEGLSHDEIAEMTGVGPSAIRMRVKRAREQLREHLGGLRDRS